MKTIHEELSATSYPGRGIMIGLSPNGKKAVTAYFIMGRSENSRNRIFAEEGEGIRTQAFDESKLEDPSLIIYSPVKVIGDTTIVTNGDQTDTIYDFLKAGKTFEEALISRKFEPDEPNFTPRISGLIKVESGKLIYKLSILKSADGNPDSCERFVYHYNEPMAGKAHFIHTYMGDGDPLPSFKGEPEALGSLDDIDEFTKECWGSLNEENKVSLFTRFIDIETGEYETRIVNKNN